MVIEPHLRISGLDLSQPTNPRTQFLRQFALGDTLALSRFFNAATRSFLYKRQWAFLAGSIESK
jgi:hypothetical protein